AAVEVVLPGPEIGEHRGHAAAHGGPALAHRVRGQWSINTHVGVGVDDAGKAQPPPGVVDGCRFGHGDVRGDASEPPVLHAEVEPLDLRPAGADDAHVLDHEI